MSYGILLLRVVLGSIVAAHGAQKLFAWFGGSGPRGTASSFAQLRFRAPLVLALATDDHMIPPSAQRTMAERASATVTETPGSHAVYVSNPKAVAGLITQAARSAVPEGALA